MLERKTCPESEMMMERVLRPWVASIKFPLALASDLILLPPAESANMIPTILETKTKLEKPMFRM